MLRPEAHRDISAAGQLSPPTKITRSSGSGATGKTSNEEGGMVIKLMRCSSRSWARGWPGRNSSWGARHKVAPQPQAIVISKREASKLSEANCSTRQFSSGGKILRCASAELQIPAWVTIAPLGLPVEPDV